MKKKQTYSEMMNGMIAAIDLAKALKVHNHTWGYKSRFERTCKACHKEEIKHTDQCCGEGWGL